MRVLSAFLLAFALTAARPASVAAQDAGTIRGVLRDETGGVVREATVTITPEGRAVGRSTRTGDEGAFEVGNLGPGVYVVRVERSGFAALTRADVAVAAGQATILELTLTAGPVEETVTVLATRSRLATKAETPVLQTPQAIGIVPEALLDEQITSTLGEALRNVSGAALSGNWRGTYEIYAQRGFYSDSDGNFRRNGIEVSKFTSILSPNADRVEVLKGPASVLYGRLDPGGVINVVTKRPQANRFTEIELRGGSFGYVDGRLDTTGASNAATTLLYRFNAAWERKDSYRDVVGADSLFMSPVFTVLFNPETKWDIDIEYKREQNTVDLGIAAPANNFDRLDAMPIDTFLGEEDARSELRYTNVLSTLERALPRTWMFRNTLSYISYDRSPHDVTLGALAPDGRMIARTADFREQGYESASGEVNLLGAFSTGPLRHRVAVGGHYHRTALDQQQFRTGIGSIDIFQPVYTGLPSTLPLVADTRQTVDMLGLFVQDQIDLTTTLHLQAGLRYSTFEQETDNRVTALTQRIDASAVSPQVGAAWLPKPWMSIYGSYSQSFSPTTFIAADGRTFDPREGEQYEGGLKADALNGRFSSTIALFRLTYNGNLSFVRNPVTGVFDAFQGGVHRSTGVEIDLTARPGKGFHVSASYARMHAEVVTDPAFQPGRPLGGAPRNRGNVWVTWASPVGLDVGGGVFHQAAFKEFTSSDFFLPGFTTAEATVSYRFSEKMRARLNVKNLFDERYYLAGAGAFVAYPAPPRHAVASVQVQF